MLRSRGVNGRGVRGADRRGPPPCPHECIWAAYGDEGPCVGVISKTLELPHRIVTFPPMLLSELKDHKIGLCVSGGLDSKTVATRLKQAGCDVLCFTADLGQPDEKDINDIVEKMRPTGTETIIVDLKDEMARACFVMVKAQAMYDGGYWNTTGIARAVTVKGLL